MNKNIIIAILIVIVVIAVGVAAYNMNAHGQNGKENTSIQFLSQDNLKNGDQVQFVLKDAKGNALANQHVNITYVENGQTQTYSIITDQSGKGFLVLKNENPGQYEVTVNYGGDQKHNGCTAKKTITIQEGESNAATSTETNSTASTAQYNKGSSSNSTSGSLYYDSQYNIVYDENGKIIGGQNAGQDAFEVISSYKQAEANDHGQGLE